MEWSNEEVEELKQSTSMQVECLGFLSSRPKPEDGQPKEKSV
jgi:hypothetical protein